jgi:hypothetical protein
MRSMKSFAATLVVVGGLCAVVAPAWGQVTIPQEYGKTIKSAEAIGALGPDLFGDQTNFYTGATTFVATDVSLPGNNALPVAIGRRLEVASREPNVAPGDGMFGDWDLDIPHLQGVFPESKGWQVENYSPSTGWATRISGVRLADCGKRSRPPVRSAASGMAPNTGRAIRCTSRARARRNCSPRTPRSIRINPPMERHTAG